MSRAVLALLLATAPIGRWGAPIGRWDAPAVPDIERTSASRGPGTPSVSRWNRPPPLPKPASQAKRRRLARRRGGR